eukprot:scaffold13673_cov89-Skeletonema_dohrnii-CCMP3373.AAC.3
MVIRLLYLSLLANVFLLRPTTCFISPILNSCTAATTSGSSLPSQRWQITNMSSSSSSSQWNESPTSTSEEQTLAKSLSIWPLDTYNVNLLNEVRHKQYTNPNPPLPIYDLVVIGAGA